MKRILAIILVSFFVSNAWANHIRGGELSYRYIGPGTSANSSRYTITLKLYIDCTQNNPGQFDDDEPFTIFRRANNSQFGGVITAPFVKEDRIEWDPKSNPCITNPPTDICYKLRYYVADVQLPDDPNGYTIAFQRCCRIAGIENLSGNSADYGATYSCDIPGTSTLAATEHNSSPLITGNDAVAISANANFTFDFSATDPDGVPDSLIYVLCNAYNGGGRGTGNCFNCSTPNPAAPPAYSSVPYQFPYGGGSPLGGRASMNRFTGIINGIAPAAVGQYVITVCIYEFRKGVLINIHRKDIHLKVSGCNPLQAVLNPDYSFCDDLLVSFKNQQANPTGTVYIWQYGDGSKADTSNDPVGAVNHQYPDTGTYTVKLRAILAGQCVDSAVTLAKVYPGFYPGFVTTGSCVLNAIGFTDTTKTKYGAVDKWRWNFGDETATNDTSRNQNPSWKYSSIGMKTVQLIVGSNKGCLDTVSVPIEVKDKPLITLAFKDTLICSIDTLQLGASGLGNFSWTPTARMLNSNSPTPLVFPTTTTSYVVTLDESGCINKDTVRVRVVDFVTLDAGPDSTICRTDSVTLRPTGDGLSFTWSPAATLNNANLKNPIATPTAATTVYSVIARIGKCNTTDNVTITTVPYPGSQAGADTVICFRDTAQLQGGIVGNRFFWTPASGLSDPNALNPLAFPLRTTSYVLNVFDNLGCPKPGLDTVVVTVRPPIIAFAGNDTSVVIGQPLQLNATGAQFFVWNPPVNLNRANVGDPIALFNTSGIYQYAVTVSTVEGCFSIDTINVKVFQTAPDIYVPNAFTPDKTQNNLFRPIPVGISRIDYFRVYNRLGNMVFSSTDGSGWDGKYAGKKQDAGSFVWVVQGRDYTGKTVSKKGTMVLLR